MSGHIAKAFSSAQTPRHFAPAWQLDKSPERSQESSTRCLSEGASVFSMSFLPATSVDLVTAVCSTEGFKTRPAKCTLVLQSCWFGPLQR